MKSRPQFHDLMEAARVSSFMEPAQEGRWKIDRFTVSPLDHQASRLRNAIVSSSTEETEMRNARSVPPGEYVSLRRKMTEDERDDIESGDIDSGVEIVSAENGEPHDFYIPIMSDTPSEIAEHAHAFEHATGEVLITGLGLGVLVSALLTKPDVTHITVVEIDRDVIALTAPYYANEPRVDIVNYDALAYPDVLAVGAQGEYVFDYAWHDIWSHISDRNFSDEHAEHGISYRAMFAAYEPFVRRQGAWAYPEAAQMKEIRDAEWLREHQWGVAFQEATPEQQVEILVEYRIRKHLKPALPPGPIPPDMREFFDREFNITDWARERVADPELHEKIAKSIDLGPQRFFDDDDRLARPNDAKEANVAR